jgi:hypothetical protein
MRYLFFVLVLSLCAFHANGQQVNKREGASPASKAKVAKALTKARRIAAQHGDAQLNRDTIGENCEPVLIGSQVNEEDEKRSLSKEKLEDEEIILIPGDVINICR